MGDVLYASEVNYINAGKIQEVYSSTALDFSVGTSSASQSYEMAEVTDVKGASYVKIYVTGQALIEEETGSLRTMTFKIESKDIGGSYSTSLNLNICSSLGTTANENGNSVGICWIHTLTNDEKTNGFQIRLTSAIPGGAGSTSASYTNKQVVVELA